MGTTSDTPGNAVTTLNCMVINATEESRSLASELIVDHVSTMTKFRDCFNSVGLVECFKNVAVQSLNDFMASDREIRLSRYLVVKKNPDFLASDVDERAPTDWHAIVAKIRDFISSRVFQFSLVIPEDRSLAEGRGKKHKQKQQGGMYMMGGVAFMAMMAQLVLGKVAMLAAVALIMAKIALIFSTLNGFKKAASGGGGGGEHVVYDHSGGHGSGGWQRSIDPKRKDDQYEDGGDLAYRRRRPDYDYRDPLEGA
ncbi:uncharacterized protein LOC129737952 [Uranotaenia lowii]|uniref:uncharacterized protein LOC129737952 n=1 Tax=Uranotaenia lowii TaxID=190385 RepID=UPI002478EB00|nr:uncharacterized protein LOC129737952 [Uranotaenia lowii]